MAGAIAAKRLLLRQKFRNLNLAFDGSAFDSARIDSVLVYYCTALIVIIPMVIDKTFHCCCCSAGSRSTDGSHENGLEQPALGTFWLFLQYR